MVLGNLPVPGRPIIWITVGQGPTALAVGAGGGCLDIFTLIYPFSPLSPSLWETARYRLKYCLKGPLNPKQPTNQICLIDGIFIIFNKINTCNVHGSIVGQGLIAIAAGAGGGCLDIFCIIYLSSFPSLSLWETARYGLKRSKTPIGLENSDCDILRWPKWLTFHFHTTSQFRILHCEFWNSEL